MATDRFERSPVHTVEGREIYAGTVWKHTKRGSVYFVTGIYRHTETGEMMVGYRRSDSHKDFWIRPLVMFMDSGGPEGAFRFVRIR
jgi:hypothetical protein